jgi:hypothetical protein
VTIEHPESGSAVAFVNVSEVESVGRKGKQFNFLYAGNTARTEHTDINYNAT